LGIERGRRTRENAYSLTRVWRDTREGGEVRYDELVSSILKNGWNDVYPLEIMLLRQMGAQDNLNDGHHRMGVCAACGIKRVAIRFAYAGKSFDWLRPLLRPLARLMLRAKRYV
jgi:hypothetical protein